MSASLRALVVADSDPALEEIQVCLEKGGIRTDCTRVADIKSLAHSARNEPWDMIIVSWPGSSISPLVAQSVIQEAEDSPPVIVVGEFIPMRDAVSFVQGGIQDVFSLDDLGRLKGSLRRSSRRNERRESPGGAAAVAATVFRSANEAILVVDAQGVIKAANPASATLMDRHPEALIGIDFSDLVCSKKSPESLADIEQGLSTAGLWQGEIWCRREGGKTFLAEASISRAADESGAVDSSVVVLRDVTQNRAIQERIWRQANFDSLTGLPNRAHFFDRLPHVLRLAQDRGRQVAVMFLDLDHFKEVNDTLGHAAGDELLRRAANHMRGGLRETDLVGRIGGDEFAIVLVATDADAVAKSVARKMLDQFHAAVGLEQGTAKVSVSIGFTIAPADGWRAGRLLQFADMAMYRAKAQGRNQWCRYDALLDGQESRARGRDRRKPLSPPVSLRQRLWGYVRKLSIPRLTYSVLVVASIGTIAVAGMVLLGDRGPVAAIPKQQIAIDLEAPVMRSSDQGTTGLALSAEEALDRQTLDWEVLDLQPAAGAPPDQDR